MSQPDPARPASVEETLRHAEWFYACTHCGVGVDKTKLTFSGGLHCQSCDEVSEMPQPFLWDSQVRALLLASETQRARTRAAIEKLIASGYLPEKCSHGEEPDYCDGCRLQMEKAQQMARIHARAVLALEDPPLPSPPTSEKG